MSEWTPEAEWPEWGGVDFYPLSQYARRSEANYARALACVRAFAGHADLAKVTVVTREDANAYCDVLRALGIEDSSETAVEVIAAKDAELATLCEQLSERTDERDGLHDELSRIAGMFSVTLSIGASQHYIYPLVQDRVQKLREQLAAREADAERFAFDLRSTKARLHSRNKLIEAIYKAAGLENQPDPDDGIVGLVQRLAANRVAAIARQEGGA